MRFRSFGHSDVGLRRKLNEDSFLADDELGLYVVADGVGGHAKGEIASAQAVEEVYGFVSGGRPTIETYRQSPTKESLFNLRRLLESAVQNACYMIFGLAELEPEHRGMSTTMSALLVTETICVVAQVGDSRVYRQRNGVAEQLTEDHTLINYKLKHGLITPEEAAVASGKNVITRAVGHKDYVQVDTTQCDVLPGDRFLLCSDGFHGYSDDAKVEVGEMVGDLPQEEAAKKLVDFANTLGGKDNITVLFVDAYE